MVDHNDNRETVERTTIVETDRGGGGLVAVVLLLLVIVALLFFFRSELGLGGSKTEVEIPDTINVNVN